MLHGAVFSKRAPLVAEGKVMINLADSGLAILLKMWYSIGSTEIHKQRNRRYKK